MVLVRKQNYGRKNRSGQEDYLSGERGNNQLRGTAHTTWHRSRNNKKLNQDDGNRSEEGFRDIIRIQCIKFDKWLYIGTTGEDYYSEDSNRNSLKMVVQFMEVKSVEATFSFGRGDYGRKQSLF